jgi:hypothetical protein
MDSPCPAGRSGRLGIARLRDARERAGQAHGNDGQVDQEDAAPREMLDQEATGDRSDGTPSPDTAARAAIALGRPFEGKTFVRIDSVVGMIAAAPRPIRPRQTMSALPARTIDIVLAAAERRPPAMTATFAALRAATQALAARPEAAAVGLREAT